jgi:molecular chaperone HtpG
VISRSYRAEDSAYKWTSDGSTTYTIESAEKENRGTDIIVYLKDDMDQFVREWTIKDIVRRHSNYVTFPVYVGDDENPTNAQKAIWRQNPGEVEDKEYNDFYKMLTMDFTDPLHRQHIRAEAPMQFYALLFIPSNNEPNMLSPRKEPGLKLYARKVLIEEYSKDLLPEYLQFIQGVVDSEDLPLSVSREGVQATRIVANLKKTITTKVLSELKRMARKKTDKYIQIYEQFARYIKQGLVVSMEDKEDIEQLLLFHSSHDDDPKNYHSLNDLPDVYKRLAQI